MKVKKCLKLVSAFYSFLTLSGGAAVGFGIWSQMKSKASDLLKTVDDVTLTAFQSLGAPMLIALGCILTVMGVIGCLGTLKKKRWMLLVFFVSVLIIFILQVILAVFLVLPNSVKEKSLSSLESKLIKSLQKSYKENDTSITLVWDETMNKLHCCGYKGYDDFTSWVEKNSYPTQCCGEYTQTHSTCTEEEAENKKVRGCIHLLLNEGFPISGALSFLIGILELSGGAAVGFGIWSHMKSKTSDLLKTVDDVTLTAFQSLGAPMLIALGCILTVMGVIGCLGTLKKKSWMLLVFFVVVLIILSLQVMVAVLMVYPNSVKEKSLSNLESKLIKSLQKSYKENDTSITLVWDETMNKKVRGCIRLLLNENIHISGALSFLIGILEIVALVVSLKVYRCLKRIPDLPDPFENNL
ncbi:Tetraspanin-1 [Anabarilius grahami]|uniref:Tetraspanin-1 n=1 Tax=Anabarilius grahami TaxID=495550 RepID=A0A3N0YK76_ANAGA|nr:Tetraspanin-1 [Anabarilius grahami]